MKTNSIIAIAPNPPPPGMLLTIESTAAILGILMSTIALTTVLVKLTSKFNLLANSINELKEDFEEISKTQEQLINDFEKLEKDMQFHDKKLDLHISDYLHTRDMTLITTNGLNEAIKHKSERFAGEIKDLQRFLQQNHSYIIRKYNEQ